MNRVFAAFVQFYRSPLASGGRLRVAELADDVLLTRSNVTRLVDRHQF